MNSGHQPIWNNKFIYMVHLVGYFHSRITMHGFMNVISYKYLRLWPMARMQNLSHYGDEQQ